MGGISIYFSGSIFVSNSFNSHGLSSQTEMDLETRREEGKKIKIDNIIWDLFFFCFFFDGESERHADNHST